MKYKCKYCGKEFEAYHKNPKYCSYKCKGLDWKKTGKYNGKNNPAYGRKRLDLIERNKTQTQREAVSKANTGKKRSEETKKLIGLKSSEARLKEKRWQGKDNPFYTENKPEKHYFLNRKLRKRVLELNDNECQKCFTKENLEIHHIIPRRLKGTDSIDNLTILCRKCHVFVELELIKLENDKRGFNTNPKQYQS